MASFNVTHFDVLRHGECEGGEIFRGRTDPALLDSGLKKMLEQAQSCDMRWDQLISSPLQRCKAFAEKWSRENQIELQFDERLLELDYGKWDGQSIDAVMHNEKEQFNAWQQNPEKYSPPSGESLANLYCRVENFLIELEKKQIGKKILIVTHGGVLRTIILSLLNLPLTSSKNFNVPYACLSRFAIYHYNNRRDVKLLAHNAGALS